MTNDSNVLKVPVRHVTQTTNNDLNQVITSTLSTSHTYISQPLQTERTSPCNYDSPPLPSQYSPHTTPHNSPQQGHFNSNGTTTFQTQPEVQFQTTRQPTLQTLSYTPAQNTQTQSLQPGLTINTLHSNTVPNYITSRNLSGPPLKTIPNNPPSFSLTSTNPHITQLSTTTNNKQSNNPFSTSHSSNTSQNTRSQTPNLAYTIIRTNPYNITTNTQPFTNPQNIPPNPLTTPTCNTVPPSTLPLSTISTPT